jgi:hypothetical protein
VIFAATPSGLAPPLPFAIPEATEFACPTGPGHSSESAILNTHSSGGVAWGDRNKEMALAAQLGNYRPAIAHRLRDFEREVKRVLEERPPW